MFLKESVDVDLSTDEIFIWYHETTKKLLMSKGVQRVETTL